MNEQTAAGTLRRLARISARFLLIVVMVVIVGLFGVRLAGMQLNVVQTASMSPSLPVDTITLIRPVDAQTIEIGDVITFVDRTERPVMHRVTEVIDHGGVRRFRTKGDANRQADRHLVNEKQLAGTLVASAPHVGAALRLTQSTWGIALFVGIQLPLLVWSWRSSDQRQPRAAVVAVPPLEPLWMVPCLGSTGHLCPAWLYPDDGRIR